MAVCSLCKEKLRKKVHVGHGFHSILYVDIDFGHYGQHCLRTQLAGAARDLEPAGSASAC